MKLSRMYWNFTIKLSILLESLHWNFQPMIESFKPNLQCFSFCIKKQKRKMESLNANFQTITESFSWNLQGCVESFPANFQGALKVWLQIFKQTFNTISQNIAHVGKKKQTSSIPKKKSIQNFCLKAFFLTNNFTFVHVTWLQKAKGKNSIHHVSMLVQAHCSTHHSTEHTI